MYTIEKFDQQGLHFFKLKDETSYVDVCPERGGIVTSFHADGEDILYLNEATLFDTTKNVRGGIPVLFPIAGQLTDKSYVWNGTVYEMANHGLARTRPWAVVHQASDESHTELTLSFQSSAETLESYPFQFEVLLTYSLADGKLSIRQKITNLSAEPMPAYPGYHPYFNISDKQVDLKSRATKYLDYNDNQIKPFTGSIDLDGLKESVVLLPDQADTRLEASFSAEKKLIIEQDDTYRYDVLWVEGDAPFVCIEPWTAKTNSLNDTKESLLMVAPERPLELNVSFHLADR
ncbi:aldose epimerase [Sporolactobacillus shoreae]|uniref:Aldose epimerase n=1 Tax=Sporolactobacillus shoreae TaxID=1465501 RepID=A0A4Z0GGY2_9BACL|nr:aldose epimerase [Sporolactobacillus shoreae]TGA95863.1 aldose epimerase [Sporolactobacillus shoreae]